MHSAGAEPPGPNPLGAMPATDDEIREKYLERAIRELNAFSREVTECALCPRGNFTPVQGSGHPQADVLMLKHAPTPPEVEEGVAFYGRAGTAIMKSLSRLGIDPLAVYGTLCVKCPVPDPALADPACVARIADEIAIVRPRIVVVMGEEALGALNDAGLALSRPLEPDPGTLQSLTPSIEALYTPDIDQSLDEEGAKRAFWRAFKVLGDWYAELPPY
jgi:uracil-DNA glycosylase